MTQKPSDQLLESLSALVDNEASDMEVRRILKNVECNPDVRDRWRSYNLIGSVLRKEVDLNLGGTVDIAKQISLALQQEQTFAEISSDDNRSLSSGDVAATHALHVESERRKGWVDFVAKSAIAASFAGALVVGFNLMSPNQVSEFEHNSGALVLGDNTIGADTLGEKTRPVAQTLNTPVGFELPRLESRNVSTGSAAQVSPARTQAFNSSQMDDITDPATQNLLNELLIHHAAKASANGGMGVMPFARVSQMPQAESFE
jgi:sigma-E factor negative regulatory protein RseA